MDIEIVSREEKEMRRVADFLINNYMQPGDVREFLRLPLPVDRLMPIAQKLVAKAYKEVVKAGTNSKTVDEFVDSLKVVSEGPIEEVVSSSDTDESNTDQNTHYTHALTESQIE